MRLSGVFDTILTIFKRNVANYQHRRVREASKMGFSTLYGLQWELGGVPVGLIDVADERNLCSHFPPFTRIILHFILRIADRSHRSVTSFTVL